MAEQYSWLDASGKGYSAGQYGGEAGKLMKWTRNTVADGKWLNKETIEPFSGRDQYLLDSLNQTYDECSAFSGDLQGQIDVIEARSDVIDVVGTYADFSAKYIEHFDPSMISDKDVIKILKDEEENNAQTYYRWLSAYNAWEYVGQVEPHYYIATFTTNTLEVKNTADDRNYKVITDVDRYIQLTADGNTGHIGLTDDFINSASQAYNALSSISGINEGSISGPKVSHTVSNYSLAQGSANSASYDSFAQGRRNYAYGQSMAQGLDNYAKSKSQALGSNNSATNDGFVAGSNNSATTTASFAQGTTNYAHNSSFAQGTSNSALTQSFAQGKDNSANYDAFAQGLSAFANNESLAQGLEVTAKNKSFAQGQNTNADINGFAQGSNCSAKNQSLAQGSNITATTTGFAQGDKCKANNIALAQGQYASANDYSMAQGQKVYANYVSFAEGEVASAKSVSFAQGNDVIADGYSFVQGHMASATNMSMAQGHNGVIAYQTSFAQGEQASAKDRGMAQGLNANANDNSFAQGYDVTATTAAFAQGNTVKSNYYSISQGLRTVADNYSISQGTNTSAQYYSIAQGNANVASSYSQAFGDKTSAISYSMAIGKENYVSGNGSIAGGVSSNIIGNGTLVIGEKNTVSADASIVAGKNNTINEKDKTASYFILGNDNVAVPLTEHYYWYSNRASIIAGYNNKLSGTNAVLLFGRNHTVSSDVDGHGGAYIRDSLIVGEQHTLKGELENVTVLGKRNAFNATGAANFDYARDALIAGFDNTVNGSYKGSMVLGGENRVDVKNDLNGHTYGNVILGEQNRFTLSSTTNGLLGAIIAGLGNNVTGSTVSVIGQSNDACAAYSNIFGYGNKVINSAGYVYDVAVGNSNVISGNMNYQNSFAFGSDNRIYDIKDSMVVGYELSGEASALKLGYADKYVIIPKNGDVSGIDFVEKTNGNRLSEMMSKSTTFTATGSNFNQTFNYTGFKLSAGDGVGFVKNGNTLAISAQAGIPDGALTYVYRTGQAPTTANISALQINDYYNYGNPGDDNRYLEVTDINGNSNKFALWHEPKLIQDRSESQIPIFSGNGTNFTKTYIKLSELAKGNYVSAGNNQKLTMISADSLTLGSMQPGIIYLV